ncbi:AAA family ATPase, partial [Streptomyces sp. NPDC001880]
GQVVASSDASTRQALISGETVNVAARLEQNAAAGEILIGPQTLEAAGPTVVVQETGPLRLKGKTDSVHAYRLIALGADDPELLRRFDVPFIGRAAELAALDEALESTARGTGPGLVRLVGDAGIGKTRLAREWLSGLGGPGRPVVGTGRCRSYGDHGTLAPLADAVREVLGSPVAREALDGASGRSGASVADAWALLRGGLLHDGTPNAPFDDMCAALITVLSRTAGRRPVLLVLDDWHWAEPLLVRAVNRLAGPLGRAGGLIVCPGRPDGPSAADPVAGPAQLLPLTGLPCDEAALLARELTRPGTGTAPDDAAPAAPDAYDRDLYDRAEGNPLYLEQLLVPAGPDSAGPAPKGAHHVRGAALPPTLQALLGARIGALERAERTTLDLAAVVGRDFTAPELVRLTRAAREAEGAARTGPAARTDASAPDDDRGRVARALARLRGRRLVETAPGGEPGAGRHRFSSGLVQEVAYASLSKRAKAERHAWASELPSVTAAGEAAVGGHLERAYRYRTELGLADDRAAALRARA